MKLTTDKALIFSAIMVTIFTAVMVVLFCLFQSVPDSLVVAFFGAFACEGGFCAFIHKIKKEAKKMRSGDITGFDDAEIVDDAPDQGELVIDLEDE